MFILRKFNVRKLSFFDWLNTISGIASVGRGWVSTGRRFCHGVVGVHNKQWNTYIHWCLSYNIHIVWCLIYWWNLKSLSLITWYPSIFWAWQNKFLIRLRKHDFKEFKEFCFCYFQDLRCFLGGVQGEQKFCVHVYLQVFLRQANWANKAWELDWFCCNEYYNIIIITPIKFRMENLLGNLILNFHMWGFIIENIISGIINQSFWEKRLVYTMCSCENSSPWYYWSSANRSLRWIYLHFWYTHKKHNPGILELRHPPTNNPSWSNWPSSIGTSTLR